MKTSREIRDTKQKFIELINFLKEDGLEKFPIFGNCINRNRDTFKVKDNTDKYLLTWVIKFNKDPFTKYFFEIFYQLKDNHDLLFKKDIKGNDSLRYAAIYDNAEFIEQTIKNYTLEYDSSCLNLAIKNGSLNFLNKALSKNDFSYETIIPLVINSCNLNYKGSYEILKEKYYEALKIKRSEYINKNSLPTLVLYMLILPHDFLLKQMYSYKNFYNVCTNLSNFIFSCIDIGYDFINRLNNYQLYWLSYEIIPECCRDKIKNFYEIIKEYPSLTLIIPNSTLEEYQPPSDNEKDIENEFIIPVTVNQVFMEELVKKALTLISENVAKDADSVCNYQQATRSAPVVRSRQPSRAADASLELRKSLSAFPISNEETTVSNNVNSTGSNSSSQQSFVRNEQRNRGSHRTAYDSCIIPDHR